MKDTEIKKSKLDNFGDKLMHNITKENAREFALKGAEVKRQNKERRKNMQDTCKWFLSLPVSKTSLMSENEIVEFASTKDINLTVQEAMVFSQMAKAMVGDTAAFLAIRDTAGEKPKDQIEVGGLTMDEYAQSHKPKF